MHSRAAGGGRQLLLGVGVSGLPARRREPSGYEYRSTRQREQQAQAQLPHLGPWEARGGADRSQQRACLWHSRWEGETLGHLNTGGSEARERVRMGVGNKDWRAGFLSGKCSFSL